MREDWIEFTFADLLDYDQPTKYKGTSYRRDARFCVSTRFYVSTAFNQTNMKLQSDYLSPVKYPIAPV